MHYDHIIIGGGSMGSAAAYYLGKLGKRVLVIDAFTPPHTEGSHHGDTRLIRFAYGEGEKYVPFVLRAKELWDELAENSGVQNFIQTGIVNIGHYDDAFIKSVQQSAAQFNLPVQKLNAQEIMEKWPGIAVPDNFICIYEETSGVLLTKEAIESYLEQAKTFNVQTRFQARVTKIDVQNNTVTVTTDSNESFTAENCIVTAGSYVKQLIEDTDVKIPVQATRKCFAWFDAPEALYKDAVYPGFTFQLGNESYYGFPSINGAGLKIGRHDGGVPLQTPNEMAAYGEVKGDREDLENFLHTFMPQVGELKFGKTCMYAMTPDEDFIIDTHPVHKEIIIAAGFSGHGFKFASAVGEALSELATNKQTTINLQPFSFDRFQ